jgi:hypothetical protein
MLTQWLIEERNLYQGLMRRREDDHNNKNNKKWNKWGPNGDYA